MWKKLADKYRNDALYRAAIDVLADRYDDGMASAIKATALTNPAGCSPAGCNPKDTFWGRLADKYRKNAVFRAATESRAEQGYNDACAIKATAFAL